MTIVEWDQRSAGPPDSSWWAGTSLVPPYTKHSMTISAEFIDQIVHNVMREMQTRTTSNAPAALLEPVTNKAAADRTISISSRVLSEKVLITANAAGRAISLQPGTVITPSGRDYIRKNDVRLTSDVSGTGSATRSGVFIAIGTHATTSAASAAGWKALTATTEFDGANLASQHAATGMVACCGGEPSVVACILNRNPAIRAAVITRATNLVTLATMMSPQVVCLDSSGWSFGDILRLLRSLAAPPLTPAHWKEISAGSTR